VVFIWQCIVFVLRKHRWLSIYFGFKINKTHIFQATHTKPNPEDLNTNPTHKTTMRTQPTRLQTQYVT